MANETARQRARHAIERLAQSSLDGEDFRRETVEVLRGAIGFDWWCWALTDPGVHLPTRYVADNPIIGRAQRRFYELLEHVDAEWGAAGGHASSTIMTTSDSTGGDLARNAVWRDLLGPAGGGDCLQAFLGVDGTCWAFLDLSRERSRGWFDERDIAFIGEVAPTLATRARGELRTPNCREDELDEPGTIVLGRNPSLVAATEAAWSWIDRLGLERPSELEPLPGFMYALATRAFSSTVSPLASARVRLPTADRRHWVVVRASPITQGQAIAGGLVLSIETARSDDLAPLLMRAWSRSPRERDVAKLVIDGLSSDEIAASLYISPHTAKDHIRAIFDKTGVHRRRDLIAALAGQGAAD